MAKTFTAKERASKRRTIVSVLRKDGPLDSLYEFIGWVKSAGHLSAADRLSDAALLIVIDGIKAAYPEDKRTK